MAGKMIKILLSALSIAAVIALKLQANEIKRLKAIAAYMAEENEALSNKLSQKNPYGLGRKGKVNAELISAAKALKESGLTKKEIGAKLNISMPTVKKALDRAAGA